jgi:hypothetical protein
MVGFFAPGIKGVAQADRGLKAELKPKKHGRVC